MESVIVWVDYVNCQQRRKRPFVLCLRTQKHFEHIHTQQTLALFCFLWSPLSQSDSLSPEPTAGVSSGPIRRINPPSIFTHSQRSTPHCFCVDVRTLFAEEMKFFKLSCDARRRTCDAELFSTDLLIKEALCNFPVVVVVFHTDALFNTIVLLQILFSHTLLFFLLRNVQMVNGRGKKQHACKSLWNILTVVFFFFTFTCIICVNLKPCTRNWRCCLTVV